MPKKDSKLQIYVDYRQLNEETMKNRYPLPLIAQLRDRLARARYFIRLDLLIAYTYVCIKADDEQKTAFRTRYKHFEYLTMPFRLINTLAIFQAIVDYTIRAYLDKFTVYYLDNILIFSKTLEEYRKYVKQVLDVLYVQKLLVNKDKSEFYVQKIVFLGYKITLREVQIELIKVEVVQNQLRLIIVIEV